MFFGGKWNDQPSCGYIANQMVYRSWKYIYIYIYTYIHTLLYIVNHRNILIIYIYIYIYSTYIYIYRFPGHGRINQWVKCFIKIEACKPHPPNGQSFGIGCHACPHGGHESVTKVAWRPDAKIWRTNDKHGGILNVRIVSSSNDLKAKPRTIFHKNAVKLLHFNLCVGWCSYWWSITIPI